jgi:hypothetical protein
MAFRACFCAFLSCRAFVLSLVFILSFSFFFASGCLYPMHWERVYIAPTTFLFGLPTNCTCFLLDLFFLVSLCHGRRWWWSFGWDRDGRLCIVSQFVRWELIWFGIRYLMRMRVVERRGGVCVSCWEMSI